MNFPIIVGNWKMHLGLSESLVLAGQVARAVEKIHHLSVVICPPSPFVFPVFDHLKVKPRHLHLGIQNAMWQAEGQFTGEVSVEMVKGVCKFVIVGHSERREIFGETDEMVARKVKYILSAGLIPIVCIGERERFDLEDNYRSEVRRMRQKGGILNQLEGVLSVLSRSEAPKLIIAYEPVWAIGTGSASSGVYAAAVAYIIKNFLLEKVGKEGADQIAVLYGGSVDPVNTKEYMFQPPLDGLLVGGASLKAREFIKICQTSVEVKSGKNI